MEKRALEGTHLTLGAATHPGAQAIRGQGKAHVCAPAGPEKVP